MKKVRTDAWGGDLPEETRRQLYAYTKAPTPWASSSLSLSRASGDALRAASTASGSGSVPSAEAEQARFSVEGAKRIAEGVVAAHVDAKLAADYLTAKALDASTDPRPEAQQSAAILAAAAAKFHSAAVATEKLKLDAARQRTADEQLRLAREKFEAAEKRLAAVAEVTGDMKLTPEEKLKELDRLFGR